MSTNLTPRDSAELEKKIGYTFVNKLLLTNALIHSSFINEAKRSPEFPDDNERLEFLGDSVLSLTVTEHLYRNTKMREGVLTRVRAAVVCEDMLAKKAAELELGEYLMLGHGEIMNNGRQRKSINADAFEALLGAMFIDGGFEQVKKFLLPRLESEIDEHIKTGSEDYKSMLQRFIQQSPLDVLEYRLVSEDGPAHERVFTSDAVLNNNVIGTGTAGSKRQAEQRAAYEALRLFDALPDEEKTYENA